MEDQNNEQELQKLILEFNKNPENQKLINYYTSKSFFEILSKPRSETVHSSFLAWILKGKDFSTGDLDSPVMGLLDIISEKMLGKTTNKNFQTEGSKQSDEKDESENNDGGTNNDKFPDELLKNVLSRSATVTVDKADTELSPDKKTTAKSKRLDIVLNCTVKDSQNNIKLLIVIENKIYSPEGEIKQVDGTSEYQTETYFKAVSNNSDYAGYKKIYIYLTPDGAEDPKCEHFIHITYQDIMDRILDPLSKSSKLSDKTKVLIQDYIKTLSVPAFTEDGNGNKKTTYSVLAVGTEEQKKLINFATTNKDLIELLKSLYSEQKGTKKKKGEKTKIKSADENSIDSNFREKYKQLFMAATAILNTCSDVDNNIISNLNELYGSESESSIYAVTIQNTTQKLGRMATARWIITELWKWKNNWDCPQYNNQKEEHKQYIKDIKDIINKRKKDDSKHEAGLITADTEVIYTVDDNGTFNPNTYKEIFKASNIYIYNQWRPENFNENFEFKDGDFEITVKLSNGQKEEANENK